MNHRLLVALMLLIGLALPWAPPALAQARFSFDQAPGNLPKTVLPSRYRLTLDLDPARDGFSGRAEIDIEVRQPATAVVLHARGLVASRTELLQGGSARRLTLAAGPFENSWSLTPDDSAPVAPGRYTLRIDYTGTVNTSGVGLYRADHRVAGRPARMLATQLEAVDARNLFPSFDEPAFRAVFELAVRAPRGYAVHSNMPQASARPEGGAVLHRFKPTPPMPSYLVAVSVGRFDTLAGRTAGVPLRIFTAPGKRAQAAYAMRSTQQLVPYFNRYFGVPYALPKLDQQAVPSVRDGAMEDWGLISYAEDDLLFDPARSSPRTQRGVFNIVAHEIAHQWFGNLVTAASWEEIWLNEAFATWMADKATAHFNPLWRTDLERRFPIDRTMARDAGGSTRAIRSGPVREAAVFDVFDDITYTKGGAVLDMLEHWLGADTFQRGLAAYMRERRFSNATAGDLWHHLGNAAQRDVAAVAASWTDQRGFPLVQVESRCEAGATRVTLAQRRLLDGAAADPAPAPAPSADTPAPLWQVPVQIARGTEVSNVLLTAERQSFELTGCRASPLVVNAGGIGFYRVRYDDAGIAALEREFTRLAPADQVSLLSDTFALAQTGEVPMARWFSLTAQIAQVTGPARTTLFDLAGTGFAFLDDAFAGTPTQPLLHAAGRRLFAPELARLGWAERPGDDPQTLKLRGTLIDRLARFDDAPTVQEALRRFDADEAGRRPLPASIRAQVVQAAGTHADAARFERLLARFKAAGGEEDRWLYARALAGGRDAERARTLLGVSLAGGLPSNVAVGLPGLVAERSPFGELAYGHALEHFDEFAKIAGDAAWGKQWLLPGAAARFNSTDRAARLLDDQQRKMGAAGAGPAARIAARINLLATVRQRDAEAISELFAPR